MVGCRSSRRRTADPAMTSVAAGPCRGPPSGEQRPSGRLNPPVVAGPVLVHLAVRVDLDGLPVIRTPRPRTKTPSSRSAWSTTRGAAAKATRSAGPVGALTSTSSSPSPGPASGTTGWAVGDGLRSPLASWLTEEPAGCLGGSPQIRSRLSLHQGGRVVPEQCFGSPSSSAAPDPTGRPRRSRVPGRPARAPRPSRWDRRDRRSVTHTGPPPPRWPATAALSARARVR
jgi:hypothetical protein